MTGITFGHAGKHGLKKESHLKTASREKTMNEKKCIVPKGMLEAARTGWRFTVLDPVDDLEKCLEAALCWLSENPIVPTEDAAREIGKKFSNQPSSIDFVRQVCTEFQRYMFIAPEPEVPEEIQDLLYVDAVTFKLPNGNSFLGSMASHNEAVIEAYRRGKKAKQ